ncbi:hypothetical protein KY084_11915 [Stakelama sp. CBK3Z-3]|uniref:Uncharacterized protein n=1 Tax=Stakelama flava TaxID=2860338 RepID=A0ABS6XQ90_9SPHN|nr:hypothetical protein [Stakelama flava]MBW4331575.1 hypothetical protein [Stakelama flava]
MTFIDFLQELKGWQPLIGTVLGFGALTWGALYNYRLGRKRDDAIREREALAVALALYSEIGLIINELARLANAVGGWYLRFGPSGDNVPAHFSDSFVFPEPTLFKALAPKTGMLSPDVLLLVTRFYGYYGETVGHFPHSRGQGADDQLRRGMGLGPGDQRHR